MKHYPHKVGSCVKMSPDAGYGITRPGTLWILTSFHPSTPVIRLSNIREVEETTPRPDKRKYLNPLENTEELSKFIIKMMKAYKVRDHYNGKLVHLDHFHVKKTDIVPLEDNMKNDSFQFLLQKEAEF